MSEPSDWELAYLLPNLPNFFGWGNDVVAVVGENDPRYEEVRAKSGAAATLMSGFKDQSNNHIQPAVIISRGDRKAPYRSAEAILALRDILAVTCVVEGWATALRSRNAHAYLYSDYFDLYPKAPGAPGYIGTGSSAMMDASHDDREFVGQCAPHLLRNWFVASRPDPILSDALLEVWNATYVTRKSGKARLRTSLFRSLQMAFRAFRCPVDGLLGTVYDYGPSIGLLVSSAEILCHPPQDSVNLKVVLDLLEKYPHSKRNLRSRRYLVKWRGARFKVPWVPKLYS